MEEEKKENTIILNSEDNIQDPLIKKESMWKYSTIILAGILIVWMLMTFTGDNYRSPTGNVITEPDASKKINITGFPLKGEENASVTIVAYSDYQCAFCAEFYNETLPSIEKEYIMTGKAKFYFKDYPLEIHAYSQKAAEAAHCVRKQKGDEGFWRMHDKLFDAQESINIENIKKWARDLDVNGAEFDNCLDSDEMTSIVQRSFREGQQDEVRGTPAFFINDKLISGSKPFKDFKEIINAELK